MFYTQIESQKRSVLKMSYLSRRSLYFYAHIWCLLQILVCRGVGKRMYTRHVETRPMRPESKEENKNWIYKLEHRGASAEINQDKKLKLN